ncbi:uncharacterized protein LOC142618427 isoform X2 [Castanea sativa]|uniref:uncharacterized protein LOC142618427 isoform X2 n=1 Tax=Castanea sativa TaxID=21020 RepID=UPI003F64FD36
MELRTNRPRRSTSRQTVKLHSSQLCINYCSRWEGWHAYPLKVTSVVGYAVDKCYKIHGYPSGYKAKGKGHSANQVSFLSTNSGDGATWFGANSWDIVKQPPSSLSLPMHLSFLFLSIQQDLLQWKTIGLGRKYQGQYILQQTNSEQLSAPI